MNILLKAFLVVFVLVQGAPAYAYVGPGLGAGVVATVLGILAGLLMLVVGVVWYPIKRLFKRRRTKAE